MDKTITEAIRLCEMGFAIHWLWPRTKIPVDGDWARAPVKSTEQLTASYRPGYNMGFRPGKWSVVGGKEICVLDVDIRGGIDCVDEAYAAMATLVDRAQPTVQTGSIIGRHVYFGFPIGTSPPIAATTLIKSRTWVLPDFTVCAEGAPDSKPAWLIELLSTGKNCVMPPSIHPDTHAPYVWGEQL